MFKQPINYFLKFSYSKSTSSKCHFSGFDITPVQKLLQFRIKIKIIFNFYSFSRSILLETSWPPRRIPLVKRYYHFFFSLKINHKIVVTRQSELSVIIHDNCYNSNVSVNFKRILCPLEESLRF
jgi:hypothetical protein